MSRTISNATELAAITSVDISGDYIQIADIDLTGEDWTPIGTAIESFTGNYDGGGYTITGLTISSEDEYVGLFGYIGLGGTVKNIRLEEVNVIGGSKVGALAGVIEGNGSASASLKDRVIEKCIVISGNVTCTGEAGMVGGLIGGCYDYSIIRFCESHCLVSGTYGVGGLVGTNDGIIQNCKSTGDVSGVSVVGGFLAINDSGGTVSKSFSIGNVTITDTENIYLGGFVSIDENNNCTNCYYDSITSEQSDTNGGSVPLTTANLKKQASFIGFDFETVWNIDEDNDYPFLYYFSYNRKVVFYGETFFIEDQRSQLEFVYGDTDLTNTATINLLGNNYIIADIDGSFVWDFGGTNERTFLFPGDYLSLNLSSKRVTIKYIGTGSHLFNIIIMDGYYSGIPYSPSLFYPNGGENILEKSIIIQWDNPEDYTFLSELVWYEIFFTDNFNNNKKTEWTKIAVVPYSTTSFNWNINPHIKGTKCRIGIRTITHNGERSNMSISASNFSIKNKKVPIASVYQPVEGGRYFSYLPITLDSNGIGKQCSARAFYQIYYSSKSLSIDWTLLLSNIPIDTDPVNLDISKFSVADDYSFKIEIIDGDISSIPFFVNNVKINSLNYFKIDTKPPIGTIKVLNNKEYTKEKNTVLQLYGFDETSGISSYKIVQLNLSETPMTTNESSFYQMTDLATWTIQGGDGVKLIQIVYKDYAGNSSEEDSDSFYFRTYKNLNDQEVTSFLTNQNGEEYNLWTAFGGDNPQLYLDQNLVSTLDGEATSLVSYDDVIYIGIVDSYNNGILQRYSSSGIIETIYDDFVGLDSIINSMVIYDQKIFLGLGNGNLYSFNGLTCTKEYTGNFDSPICSLGTDGNVLFIFLDNSKDFYILSKKESGEYVYTKNTLT